MTPDIEDRLDQISKAVVEIGRIIADELGMEGNGPIYRVKKRAEVLEQDYAAAGKTETARLIGEFHRSMKTPWSLTAWIDKRLGPPV